MKEPKWLAKERGAPAEMPKQLRIGKPKPLELQSKNVKRFTLDEMLEKDGRFAKKAFLSRRLKDGNPYAAFLGSGFEECNFLFVDKGKKAELELTCDSSLSMNFIFLGEGARLRLFTTVVSDSMNAIEVDAGEGSRLDGGLLKHKGAFAYHGQAATAGTGARINSASFWGGSGFGELLTELRGVQAEALHISLSSGGDSEDVALNSKVMHYANDSGSDVIMRGVAQDSSRTEFHGHVGVERSGRGSRSSLEQQILLLDRKARAEASPVLEILNNDVECSHSAAVRQLEDEKLFYLMSRGLGRDTAKKTMVMGFLRSAMNRIKDRELRNMFMPPFMRD
jgi:hypothetical protein